MSENRYQERLRGHEENARSLEKLWLPDKVLVCQM